MAYIGRSVDVGIFEKQVLTPDSSTTSFALTYAVGSANSLFVVYGGVVQEPGVAYSVSGGGQTIVFSEAPATGTTLYIIYYGKQLTTPRAAGQETTKQTFSGDAVTTVFTLTDPPVVPAGIMVFVDGILQREGSGNNFVSSGSTIAFTAAPDSGAEIDVYTLVKEKVSIDTVADGSITRAKLAASHPYWDASGNVGLGVAPSAWALGARGVALELQDTSSSFIGVAGISGIGTEVMRNAYYGGSGWTYKGAGAASRYVQTGGNHQWHTAAVGTAGAAITFAQAMTLDTSGNLGINNTSPSTKLDINSGVNGGITLRGTYNYSSDNYNLRLINNGSTYGYVSQVPAQGGIMLADGMRYYGGGPSTPDSTSASSIQQVGGSIIFTTNAGLTAGVNFTPTEAGRFNSAQRLLLRDGIALGNVSYTDGIGVKFPAAQVASSDPNTLDDYEEGSWTPLLTASSTWPTVTYTVQRGTYTKVGRHVYASFYVAFSSFTGGGGNVQISGLPFSSGNIGGADNQGGGINEHNGAITYPAGKTYLSPNLANGNTYVSLVANGSGNNGTYLTLGTHVTSTTTYILGWVEYTANA